MQGVRGLFDLFLGVSEEVSEGCVDNNWGCIGVNRRKGTAEPPKMNQHQMLLEFSKIG